MCLWLYTAEQRVAQYYVYRKEEAACIRNGGERTDRETESRHATSGVIACCNRWIVSRQVLLGNFYRTGSTLDHFAISARQFIHWLVWIDTKKRIGHALATRTPYLQNSWTVEECGEQNSHFRNSSETSKLIKEKENKTNEPAAILTCFLFFVDIEVTNSILKPKIQMTQMGENVFFFVIFTSDTTHLELCVSVTWIARSVQASPSAWIGCLVQ